MSELSKQGLKEGTKFNFYFLNLSLDQSTEAS